MPRREDHVLGFSDPLSRATRFGRVPRILSRFSMKRGTICPGNRKTEVISKIGGGDWGEDVPPSPDGVDVGVPTYHLPMLVGAEMEAGRDQVTCPGPEL